MPELQKLTEDQWIFIEKLVKNLVSPTSSWRATDSDLFPSDRALGLMLVYLITHHALSEEPFRKEKFEYALAAIARSLGRTVQMPKSRTNPGLDLVVDGQRWSLKSQANRAIKAESVHISKWMELGRGAWGDRLEDIVALRDRLLEHLSRYDRVFVMRCLTPGTKSHYHYEVIEILKSLIVRADGAYEIDLDSNQQGAKPATYRVNDEIGLCFELYFDAGSERKLQVRKLRKDLCRLHAEWRFEIAELRNVK